MTHAELRAQAAAMEARESEPVAWTTELALECSGRAIAFEVCAANIWGERGVPLYRHPDPRIAELEGANAVLDNLCQERMLELSDKSARIAEYRDLLREAMETTTERPLYERIRAALKGSAQTLTTG